MPEADVATHPFGAGGADYVLLIRKVILTYSVLYLMINTQRQGSRADSSGDTAISRRSVLAAGGIVVFGGLSGCLDRMASAVTNTGASPAAVFAGSGGGGGRVSIGEPRVFRLTPTISGGAGGVSGEVELEGWATATSLVAANYNNTRSNRSGIRASDTDPDSDGDGVDDGTDGARANYNNTRSNRSGVRPPDIVDDELEKDDETYQVVLRLDTRLEEATAAAWRSISKRSARTGRNPELDEEASETLDDVGAALAALRAELERCTDEVCVAALANVADREADLLRARAHVENEEWVAFGLGGDDDNDLLLGDYFLPPATFDPADSYSVGEQAELYRYLDGEAVVAERCTVCLPDAEVPGGNGSIREGVTPKRIMDYLTGEGQGTDHGWGGNINAAADGGGDCDDGDPDISPGKVCGSSPHFVAEVTEPVGSAGSLEAVRATDGTLVVTSPGPTAEGGASILVCPAEGEAYEPENLQGYGTLGGDLSRAMDRQGRIQDTIVAQVQVQPPGCPHPFPALFYVGRGESDGQLLYSGGWVVDDAALYETSLTMLTLVDSALVVGIECCFDYTNDNDVNELMAVVEREASGERALRGARLDAGTVGGLVEAGVLTAGGKKGYDQHKSRTSGETQEGDGEPIITHLALDAPVLHLVNADSASNEVKFKAGAELSGQVN